MQRRRNGGIGERTDGAVVVGAARDVNGGQRTRILSGKYETESARTSPGIVDLADEAIVFTRLAHTEHDEEDESDENAKGRNENDQPVKPSHAKKVGKRTHVVGSGGRRCRWPIAHVVDAFRGAVALHSTAALTTRFANETHTNAKCCAIES